LSHLFAEKLTRVC